jgi:hypothetical protein
MATQTQRITDALYHLTTQLKATRQRVNGNEADLSGLTTTQKSSLMLALNEVKAIADAALAAGGAQIDDGLGASASKTWSISKIVSEITSTYNALTTGAPGALNTLDELAAALGDDANFAATITAALANRVRTDVATQGLTATQQTNARTNIGAYGIAEIGDPDTDLVAVINAALSA